MSDATFTSLSRKAGLLQTLLGARESEFGHAAGIDAPDMFIEMGGITIGASAPANGGTGSFRCEFTNARQLHAYLNDKIRLFGAR